MSPARILSDAAALAAAEHTAGRAVIAALILVDKHPDALAALEAAEHVRHGEESVAIVLQHYARPAAVADAFRRAAELAVAL